MKMNNDRSDKTLTSQKTESKYEEASGSPTSKLVSHKSVLNRDPGIYVQKPFKETAKENLKPRMMRGPNYALPAVDELN